MAGDWLDPDVWALIILAGVLGLMGFLAVVGAVSKRGGRR